jgi:hypothetical protein
VVQMPDVDAMIDEITQQATNPDRNPTSNGGRGITDSDENDNQDTNGKKRRSRKRTPTPRPGSAQEIIDSIQNGRNGRPGNDKKRGGDCPFANLPENQRPDSPLWDC